MKKKDSKEKTQYMPIGLCIGMCIGSVLDSKKRETDTDDEEEK